MQRDVHFLYALLHVKGKAIAYFLNAVNLAKLSQVCQTKNKYSQLLSHYPLPCDSLRCVVILGLDEEMFDNICKIQSIASNHVRYEENKNRYEGKDWDLLGQFI